MSVSGKMLKLFGRIDALDDHCTPSVIYGIYKIQVWMPYATSLEGAKLAQFQNKM